MRVGHQQSSFPPFLFSNGKHSALHKKLRPPVDVSAKIKTTFSRPVISKEAFSATMDNYRAFVAQANAQIALLNRDVSKHNKQVKTPSKTKQAFVDIFKRKYAALEPKEYNLEVAKFAETHGYFVKMKKHQGIKPAAELVFAAMLHSYSVQLRKICDRRDKHNIQYEMTLPRIEVNTEFLTCQTRNGIVSLDYCKKTIRNHRNRLEKYGVLQDYEYHGTNKPVDYRINPSILVVFEHQNEKTQNAENQFFKSSQRKNLPHNDVDTRTNLKKLEIKGKVDKPTSPNADVAMQRPFKIFFYKSNHPQDAENANQGPRENCEKSAQYLKNSIAGPKKSKETAAAPQYNSGIPENIPVYDLASQLSDGKYDHYTPIPAEKLKQLATFSNYTLAEYREIILQDAIKYAARLWKKNHANPGSWSNAIKLIYNEYKTLTPTGEPKNKAFMHQWLLEFRHRIRYALKWFIKNEWDQVRYPSIYFDPSRNLSTDVCFAFTAKAWSQNQKKKAQYRKLRQTERVVSSRKKSTKKKENRFMLQMDAAIRKYKNGTYHIDDLFEAIAKLPEEIQQKFDERFNKLTV